MLRKDQLNEALGFWTKKFGPIRPRYPLPSSIALDASYSIGDATTNTLRDVLDRIKGEAEEIQAKELETLRRLKEQISFLPFNPNNIAEGADPRPDGLMATLRKLAMILWEGDSNKLHSEEELNEVSSLNISNAAASDCALNR